MVKDHSVREKIHCCHMDYSSDWQQGIFYMQHPTDRIAHTTAFVTPVVQVKGRKQMFYLTTHSTHFIYGYTASDIW